MCQATGKRRFAAGTLRSPAPFHTVPVALVMRTRPAVIWAGLALGLAAGMKATTWPALAVAFALLARRDGWRAAARFALVAVAVVVACVGPFLTHPQALVDEFARFAEAMENGASANGPPAPREAAIGTLALMVGGMILARAMKGHAISDEILAASCSFGTAAVQKLTGRPGKRRKTKRGRRR